MSIVCVCVKYNRMSSVMACHTPWHVRYGCVSIVCVCQVLLTLYITCDGVQYDCVTSVCVSVKCDDMSSVITCQV